MGQVFKTVDELIAGVSKESGVKSDDVRKVLRASFDSTKAYILRELSEKESAAARLREKAFGSIQV